MKHPLRHYLTNIQRLYESGWTIRDIADKYGVSDTYLYQLLSCHDWYRVGRRRLRRPVPGIECSLDGCKYPMVDQPTGYCKKHYARWSRYGDPHKALLCVDCGNPSGSRQRCQPCAREYRQTNPPSASSFQYRIYRNSALIRGIEWSLSEDEAYVLFNENCHYCGTDPGPRCFGGTNKTPYIDFLNGIDRIDSNKGYIAGNVVPACKVCNLMKGTLSIKEFLRACRAVTAYAEGMDATNLKRNHGLDCQVVSGRHIPGLGT